MQTQPTGLLTAEQVSEQLAIPVRAVYRLARQGELASVRIGRLVRFRADDVQRFIDARSSAPRRLRRVS